MRAPPCQQYQFYVQILDCDGVFTPVFPNRVKNSRWADPALRVQNERIRAWQSEATAELNTDGQLTILVCALQQLQCARSRSVVRVGVCTLLYCFLRGSFGSEVQSVWY
jgi:hypothetical protein